MLLTTEICNVAHCLSESIARFTTFLLPFIFFSAELLITDFNLKGIELLAIAIK